jgi:hypothetical protein
MSIDYHLPLYKSYQWSGNTPPEGFTGSAEKRLWVSIGSFPQIYICRLCGERFIERGFMAHLESKHPNT